MAQLINLPSFRQRTNSIVHKQYFTIICSSPSLETTKRQAMPFGPFLPQLLGAFSEPHRPTHAFLDSVIREKPLYIQAHDLSLKPPGPEIQTSMKQLNVLLYS